MLGVLLPLPRSYWDMPRHTIQKGYVYHCMRTCIILYVICNLQRSWCGRPWDVYETWPTVKCDAYVLCTHVCNVCVTRNIANHAYNVYVTRNLGNYVRNPYVTWNIGNHICSPYVTRNAAMLNSQLPRIVYVTRNMHMCV